MPVRPLSSYCNLRRSREGAWIEIDAIQAGSVIGDSRSREGAWIEIKYRRDEGIDDITSLPRGSVD